MLHLLSINLNMAVFILHVFDYQSSKISNINQHFWRVKKNFFFNKSPLTGHCKRFCENPLILIYSIGTKKTLLWSHDKHSLFHIFFVSCLPSSVRIVHQMAGQTRSDTTKSMLTCARPDVDFVYSSCCSMNLNTVHNYHMFISCC